MRKLLFLLAIIFLGLEQFAVAQQITVDNSLSAQELIENNLVQGCVEVSNISSNVNGLVNGLNSFGYFEQADSNFPFTDGIILSTGDSFSAGNTLNTNTLNEGEDTWGTDLDLEAALGITNTLNATSIEFDFISVSNQIQFNYLLASEEYYGNFPCEYADGFAFLIKLAGSTDPYTNIALVPGTTTPVNTSTIHPEVVGFCGAENESYFGGYNFGDTNYNGRTTILSANASIIPNTAYHIKLIIADQTDENYDSAVFIEGNSFNSVVDLGEDITTCSDTVTINGDIQNPEATYNWYLNNTLLPGETSTDLVVSSSGIYSIQITIPFGDSECTIDDSIEVTLNSEQFAESVSDYELCDDLSGDESEVFDLSNKNAEVEGTVPNSTYNISYHFTENDADNNLNAITSSIQNTANPQTIYVRIEDTNNGCLAFTNFNLVVNPLPDVTDPTPLNICDDEISDGFTEIDLTLKNDEIINNQSNLNASYFYSQFDASNNQNEIISPYINTNPTDTIYVRIEDSDTGCISYTTLTVNVLENPSLPVTTVVLDACDQDHDGFASFDLNAALSDIIQGLSGIDATIHVSIEDANSGDNPILDLDSFTNTEPDMQILYVRVENSGTGCYSIGTIEVHTNLLITGTEVMDFQLCDDDSNDGQEIFDMVDIETTILNGIPGTDVIFYLSEDDLNNQINAIDDSGDFLNTMNPQVLYLEIISQNCIETAQIQLMVNPALLIQPIGSVDYCDTDDDGFTSIELSIFDEQVSNGNLSIAHVRYFTTQQDAENNENALPNFYTNTSNPQTIFTRIINSATGCYDVTEFELNVIPAPSFNVPSDIIICDDDQDGMYVVDLDAKISEMLSNTIDLEISFHLNQDDANTNSNAIINTNAFNTSTQTVFTRIESTSTGCFTIVPIPIIVNTLPAFTTISDYQLCEDDNDHTSEFIFSTKDDEILNGQTGKQVLYYETESDATNGVNQIDKDNIYLNTTSPQTIYVRVENTSDNSCFATNSFSIVVDPLPDFNPPLDWYTCDDASNDGVETFDLNEKITEISNGTSQDLDISFYTSFEEATNSINEIDLEFSNVQNPQPIFVRIENGFSCYTIAEFGLNVIQAPETNDSIPLETCDDDYDGISTFDLTLTEYDILDVRQNEIEVSYFENEDDLNSNINQIANPGNYTNLMNPQTVYVKVKNTVSLCYLSIPLDLVVNLPPAVNSMEDLVICEEETGIFDLTTVNELLVDDLTNVEITFFNTQTDALNNTNEIDHNFNYTINTHVFYARIQNAITGCFITSSFNVIVLPNPIAYTPNDLELCDDDDDEIAEFNLSLNTSAIRGNQNPNNFNVSYYETLENAETGENSLDSSYFAFNGQIIYARVENNSTGCYEITQFQTIVRPLPLVDIADQLTLCLNDEIIPVYVSANTNNPDDTYLWSTNETTPEIEISTIGNYWVTVTTPYGCQTTEEFTIIESEQATIELTETIDFSDPNNVTVTVSGIGDYLYVLDDGEPQESNVFEYVSLGYHTITIIDINGCNDISKQIVVVDTPKFFTPNGDGHFDTWHISGVETMPGTVVFVYDRYGKLLKTLAHNSPGWDGTYNGAQKEGNDYWFTAIVRKNDKEFEVKGHFALKR
ncbi:MAG: T9SS type B sorting domain-containing protein [Flavobacteriaceae bacterium]|nr:T9SS type B sorting domain-containing protein [Flavobacteriaceae bacterium]